MTTHPEGTEPELTVVNLPLGISMSYAPSGYTQDPANGQLIAEVEVEEAEHVLATADARREERLEALYASLEDDPDRLGLVYQVVGGGTDPENTDRVIRRILVLFGTVTAALGAAALWAAATGEYGDMAGALAFMIWPSILTWRQYKHWVRNRGLVAKGRALTTRRLGDDPSVVAQVEETLRDRDAERLAGAIRVLKKRRAAAHEDL